MAMGAVTQLRIMGGALGLSIVTSAMQTLLRSKLGPLLDPEQLEKVLASAREVSHITPAELQQEILFQFAEGYNLQIKDPGRSCGWSDNWGVFYVVTTW